jgi:hypothetical protein
MLRNLQTNGNSFANGMNSAKVDIVRGAFVKVDEATKTFDLATGIAGVKIVDRGTKLTTDLAMGMPISVYDTDQDTILTGERGYMNELEGRWATTEYDSTVNASLAVGSYLTISAGKLVASPSNAVTIIKFIGMVSDCGHTLAGFEVDATAKLA